MSKNPEAEVRQAIYSFMDMVGHDIVNDHQAVLSYLELVLAERDLDPRIRAYAQKAVSHVRTSTMMVENTRRLIEIMCRGKVDLRPFDLLGTAVKSASEIPVIFPDKNIKVKLTSGTRSAMVLGDDILRDLILNLLVNAVRLDPVSEISLELRLKERKSKGQEFWTIEVEDTNAKLPSAVKLDNIQDLISKDSSVTVKMSGIMFAKLVAERLGGDFEAEHMKPKGAVFRVSLRKAGIA